MAAVNEFTVDVEVGVEHGNSGFRDVFAILWDMV